jgi:phage host-nuclease inhibitor protein Gam
MDTHLVQITDLVKDYAKIIDELRKENSRLIERNNDQAKTINNLHKEIDNHKNHQDEILELRKKNSEFIKRLNDQSVTINTLHKDSSFWKQREELKEENRILREALSDIAANLGNGSTVSVDASLSFIKDLPHEVKLVCDRLRKELAREQKTCNNLREELNNPPPDVQEKVLDMLGVYKGMVDLIERYNELRREIERLMSSENTDLKFVLNHNLKHILKKHDDSN